MRAGTKRVVESFATLFRTEAPFVWRVLRRHGVPERELEDACQEVFVVVHRKQESFEGRASVRTWLYAIARRVASHHTRAMRARPPLAEADGPELAAEASSEPEQELDRRRQLGWLESALADLDEDKREVFILYELELLTVAEVAAAVGCNESTALYRLHAARAALRSTLKRRELVVAPPPAWSARKEAP